MLLRLLLGAQILLRRNSFLMPVNETWYFTNDPDVAASVRHALNHQRRRTSRDQANLEGRLPYPMPEGGGKSPA